MTAGRHAATLIVAVVLVSGAAAEPSGSPPPGAAVFSKQSESGLALHVGRSDGTEAVRITAGPRDDRPRWSPDGTRIVFERTVAEDVGSVWIVKADGTDERLLDPDPYAEHPRFSPNGRWIAYQVQTSETIPDGRRANTTYELWLVRPNGTGRRLLVRNGEGELGDDNPRFHVESGAWAWSPDSRRIAFVRPGPDAERSGVHVVELATGTTKFVGRGVDVAWSTAVKALAVTTENEHTVGEPECGTVWIVTLASGERRRLARPPAGTCDLFPRWSPDGRSIVFVRSGKQRVYMQASPNGDRPRRVARLRPSAQRWPDCSELFEYVTPRDAGWVVSDAGGSARFVTSPLPRGDWRCTTS